MNIKTFIAAIAVTAAGSAAAGEIFPYVDHTKFTGNRTRTEVHAELRAAAPLSERVQEFAEPPRIASGRTREEVRAELARDYAEGNRVATRNPEFVDFSHVVTTRRREEVQGEAIEAARASAGNASSGG